MTAINTSRKLLATLAAALSLLIIICMMSVPAFAEDATTTAAETTAAEVTTTSETTTDAAESTTSSETTASTEAGTTAATTEAATTEHDHDHDHDHGTTTGATTTTGNDNLRGIINLVVGGVILVVLVVLCIVFRKKIPGFVKSMKSETGKIVWCPKDQLKKKAVVVIITILALILIIALLDFAFSEGLQLLRGATAGLRK